jgi:DNA-binding winged helix-turn-helix (wHTH) protein/TolB-like protein
MLPEPQGYGNGGRRPIAFDFDAGGPDATPARRQVFSSVFTSVSSSYAFGPFHYDPEQRLLFRGEEVIPLVPKAIDTLHVLLERRGRVVEKGELMKLVWPDAVVEEVGLARNISLLRKALEEGGDGATYIETIPKRGYRFLAAPASAPAQIPAPRRPRWPAAVAAVAVALAAAIYWQFYTPSQYLTVKENAPSLAVAPFACLSGNCVETAEGFSELVVAGLAKLGSMNVLSPSTVQRHRRIGNSMGLMGRVLGLDVLVEGTMQRVGDRVVITSRLVDVRTGKLIWADTFEYREGEQRSAAQEVVGGVASHLAIREAFPSAPPSR